MKVEFYKRIDQWTWHVGFGKAEVYGGYYTRRRDAVRGYERFCAAIKKGTV